MNTSSISRLSLPLTLIASAVLLAACGGGASTSNSGSATASVSSDTSIAAAPSSAASTTTIQESASSNVAEQVEATDAALSHAAIEASPSKADAASTTITASATPAPSSTATGTTTATTSTTTTASASPYVTVQNGHFYKNGQRLKIWGINLSLTNLKSYSEIDNMVSRLQSLGFNGVRLWATQSTFYTVDLLGRRSFVSASKGDLSELDRFDYLVAKLSAAGMSLHMTMLENVGLPTLAKSTDAEVKQWATAARSDTELMKIATMAPYISPAWKSMLKSHYTMVLGRMNFYTNRSYTNEPAVSTWELANESRFVECTLTPSCVQGLPSIVYQTLSNNWAASTKWNPSGAPLPSDLSTLINSSGYTAYARFISESFYNVSADLRTAARAVGGSSSGVAVQPFLFNTGPASPNAVAHFTYSRGDAMSMGAYRSPMASTVTGGFENSPWLPVTMGGKAPSLVEAFHVKDKPFIIYETSFFRPYDYRAEWGPMMAAMGLRQDWDVVFLYSTGLPDTIYTNTGAASDYGTRVIPDPVIGLPYKDNYFYGFQHGGDPAAMASWSLASRLFLSVSESPQVNVKWTLIGNDIFAAPTNYGYPSKFLSRLSDGRTNTMVVDFTWDTTSPCLPCTYTVTPPTSFNTVWDTTGQKLTITTPGGTAVAGLLTGDLGQLATGVSAKMETSGFGVVAALNSDPTGANTTEKTLYMISKVENSGKVFDPLKVDLTQAYGAMNGMVSQGTLPLVYTGPVATFTSSAALGFTSFGFNLQANGASTRSTSYSYRGDSGSFIVRATP